MQVPHTVEQVRQAQTQALVVTVQMVVHFTSGDRIIDGTAYSNDTFTLTLGDQNGTDSFGQPDIGQN